MTIFWFLVFMIVLCGVGGEKTQFTGLFNFLQCTKAKNSKLCVQAGILDFKHNRFPRAATTDLPFKEIFASPGSKIKLRCELGGGVSNLVWTFNGNPLSKSDRYTIKGQVLKIKNVEQSDQGVYHCKDHAGHSPNKRTYLIVAQKVQNNKHKLSGNNNGTKGNNMSSVMSNLTTLWKYIKDVEKRYKGGVHLHADGAKMATDGNQININLNVKKQKCADDDEEKYASCVMLPNMPMVKKFKANHRVQGVVRLSQMGRQTPMRVVVDLSGFDVSGRNPQHAHGFHLHTYGNTENGCETTGSHYNPDGVNHGAPDADIRHPGDLGNIHCDVNGISRENLTDRVMTMYGPRSVIGRSIIIHEGSDDMGLGGTAASRRGGNAGTKIACCIIGLSAKP